MKILIIEDDQDLAQSLRLTLEDEYGCTISPTAADGLRHAMTGGYDLILLDVELPDQSGFAVCQTLRGNGTTIPILFLTGKFRTTGDAVAGLELGADDYLLKPVDRAELRARIRARLRRASPERSTEPLSYKDITVDTSSRMVTRANQPITLRRKEFDLLEYFLRNPSRVVTRDMILDHVWGTDAEVFTNAVDVHIKYLRDKIDKPFRSKLIQTVHGVGYKFE